MPNSRFSRFVLTFFTVLALVSYAGAADSTEPSITSQSLLDATGDNVLEGGEEVTVVVTAQDDNHSIKSVRANVTSVDTSSFELTNESASGNDWDRDGQLESDVFGANITFDGSGLSDQLRTFELTSKAIDNSSSENAGELTSDSTLYTVDVGDFVSGGSGTQADPYKISQTSHLSSAGAKPNAYYEITSDIDASTSSLSGGRGFRPVKHFNGTLNGNSHTINGLYIDRTGNGGFGLFSNLKGEIRNLELQGFTVNGGEHTGSLAGIARDSSIRNVNLSTAVTGGANTGGLVGQVRASSGLIIQNINADVDISGEETSGGLIGIGKRFESGKITVKDFDISGDVSSSAAVGGIVGQIEELNFTASDGSISGNLDSSDTWTGGIVGIIGQAYGTTVTGSQNMSVSNVESTGSFHGYSGAGGLIGMSEIATNISNSSFNGNITGSFVGGLAGQIAAEAGESKPQHVYMTDVRSSGYVNGTSSGMAGGLIGIDQSDTVLKNSNSSAYVYNVNTRATGGLIGQHSKDLRIENSGFSGLVDASSNVGGIVGGAFGTEYEFINIDSTGRIEATGNKAGGLVGIVDSQSLIVRNVANNDDISSNGGKVGGIVGSAFSDQIKMSNLTNRGTISAGEDGYGDSNAGGIVGIITGGGTTNVTEVINHAYVQGDSRHVGGIFGSVFTETTVLADAENYANVTSNGAKAGGIVGAITGETTFRNVHHRGKIESGSDSYDFSNAGGLAGIISGGDVNLIDSSVKSDINATGSRAGGLSGFVSRGDTNFMNLSYSGNIDSGKGSRYGNSHTGGAVGGLDATNSNMINIEVNANLTATGSRVGGVVGGIFGGSHKFGDITSNGEIDAGESDGSSHVGGLAGIMTSSTADIVNIVREGDVSADSTEIGGLVGALYGDGAFTGIDVSSTVSGGNYTAGLAGKVSQTNISDSQFDGQVVGGKYTGGLAGGAVGGKFFNAHSMGTVNGDNSVGGVIGYSNGTVISEVYSEADISGKVAVGGIIGNYTNDTAILKKSYATGDISGEEIVGGAIGNHSGVVEQIYSKGAVSGNMDVGGLIGKRTEGSVSGSYWDTQTSEQSSSDGGTGLTSSELKTESNLDSFDFQTTWQFVENANNGYPVLRAFGLGAPSVSLSWVDTSDNEEGFNIYTNASGNWTRVGRTDSNTESFVDTNSKLESASFVCYRVAAYNQLGESSPLEGCLSL